MLTGLKVATHDLNNDYVQEINTITNSNKKRGNKNLRLIFSFLPPPSLPSFLLFLYSINKDSFSVCYVPAVL